MIRRQYWAVGVIFLAGFWLVAWARGAGGKEEGRIPVVALPTNALSLVECLNLALQRNSAILRSQSELEAAYGIVIQTRAIVLPKVQITGSYQAVDEGSIDKLQITAPAGFGMGQPFSLDYSYQNWNAQIRLVQSIYEGGRMSSAVRSARFTREQAVAAHHAAVADALLAVRLAYDGVLLTEQLIVVQEASVKLLTMELDNTTRRYDAGTVPKFNVLRAEVELANARPRLIKARHAYRIAKNHLVHLLGYQVPKEIWEDIPVRLSGRLAAEPYEVQLPAAISRALEQRSELTALRQARALSQEATKTARAGYLPSLQVFGGYGSRNSSFSDDLTFILHGWSAGAQLTWNLFDGLMTKGKIAETKAREHQAEVNLDDTTRRIELEVRTSYSTYIEAKEVLESQKKVLEQAEEALRLAAARSDAGTGTQLDVLSAQTSLTEARTTQIQALHDYSVARSRLERAIGDNLFQQSPSK